VTVTLGTGAPFVSVTIPSIDPVVDDWPNTLKLNSAIDTASNPIVIKRREDFMLGILSSSLW
jgi:hypothetical protein